MDDDIVGHVHANGAHLLAMFLYGPKIVEINNASLRELYYVQLVV
jgi:hypothetical protein